MRIRTILLAGAVAALPALAIAQSQPDTTPPAAAANPAATPDATAGDQHGPMHHHRHGHWRHEMRERYAKLSPDDKAKFDGMMKQIHDLRHQQMQLLGMGKS